MENWTKEKLIAFEDDIVSLYKDCKLPFLFHLSGGNENQLLRIFKNIIPGDYVLSNHRGHYHALLHGMPPEVVRQRIIDGRSMFLYDRERNYFTSAIIGGTPAIAAGIAWALKHRGSDQKVWCFVGDGTEDSGHLAEAVRYVDGWDLPCKFIIENNDRSVEANNEDRWGKTADLQWNSPSVIKYYYDITYPHARTTDMIDLGKTNKKTDEEYFPSIPQETFPSFDDIDAGDLSYKDAITKSMTDLGESGSIFVGYNVKRGGAMGTLKGVPEERLTEMPVAENLMAGLGIGMSFEGIKPVVFLERHDFMLVAADAIANHADKIHRISHREYNVPVVFRTVVADAGPFYSGPTHSQDLTAAFKELVDFPVFEPTTAKEVLIAYEKAKMAKGPVMIVERKRYL
jgi:pyruvate dehydrogenase E1 component alpha subunit